MTPSNVSPVVTKRQSAMSSLRASDRGWGTVFERHFVEYVNSAAT
jgi:hypothetical protein